MTVYALLTRGYFVKGEIVEKLTWATFTSSKKASEWLESQYDAITDVGFVAGKVFTVSELAKEPVRLFADMPLAMYANLLAQFAIRGDSK